MRSFLLDQVLIVFIIIIPRKIKIQRYFDNHREDDDDAFRNSSALLKI
jgi:hypothetical protein